MQNKIVIVVLFIIAIVFVYLVATAPKQNGALIAEENPDLPLTGFDPENIEQTLPLSNSPKDVAWALFQKYLAYNQIRDLDGVKSVVYKIAPVCEDPKTKVDCEIRMGAAHSYGIALEKADFRHLWEDDKQIILSTDFWTEEDEFNVGRFRSIIYFIRDSGDNLKLLSFSPAKGVVYSKGSASREELEERVVLHTEDNDLDGIADYQEQCLVVAEGEACVKTDPRVRDTDGDGLWDGIEVLLNLS